MIDAISAMMVFLVAVGLGAFLLIMASGVVREIWTFHWRMIISEFRFSLLMLFILITHVCVTIAMVRFHQEVDSDRFEFIGDAIFYLLFFVLCGAMLREYLTLRRSPQNSTLEAYRTRQPSPTFSEPEVENSPPPVEDDEPPKKKRKWWQRKMPNRCTPRGTDQNVEMFSYYQRD